MAKDIQLNLTSDEAYVIFELVKRFSDSGSLAIEHKAEERALWNLGCLLEEKLEKVFDKDYSEIIELCRERLEDD